MNAQIITLPPPLTTAEWATLYDSIGLQPLAIRPNDKRPLAAGWQTATLENTVTLINATPGANLGIAVPAGFVVLDVDSKSDGPATLAAFEIEHGHLADTLSASSQSGGSHFWFQLPQGLTVSNAVGIAPGLDVRTKGGYVVAAPSTVEGRSYAWRNWGSPIAPCPVWLLELMAHKPSADKPRQDGDATSPIPDGMRNDTLHRAGAAMRGQGFDHDTIHGALLAMNVARCNPPLEAAEVATIAGSASRYEPQVESWGVGFGQSPLPAGAMATPPHTSSEPKRAERVSIGDLFSSPPAAQRFLIDKILPAGVVTLLGAHGGAGKSILALTAAVCLVTGRPFMGKTVEKCRVICVSGEDPAPVVRRRLSKICRHTGVDPNELAAGLMVLDATENPILYNGAGTGALAALRLDVAEFNPGAIIVDNASDAYDANEIERARVREFIRLLASLGKENNAAVLLLAHVDKNTAKDKRSSEGYSGSTAWHNSARSRLFLTNDDGRLTLEHQKSNLGLPSEPIHLIWSEGGLLVQVGAPGGADDKALVLRLLTEFSERGLYAAVAPNSPNNAYRVLSVSPEFPKGLSKGGLAAVMHTLEIEGAIRREEIKGLDRHTKIIFLPTAGSAGSVRDVQLAALITNTPAPAGGVC